MACSGECPPQCLCLWADREAGVPHCRGRRKLEVKSRSSASITDGYSSRSMQGVGGSKDGGWVVVVGVSDVKGE